MLHFRLFGRHAVLLPFHAPDFTRCDRVPAHAMEGRGRWYLVSCEGRWVFLSSQQHPELSHSCLSALSLELRDEETSHSGTQNSSDDTAHNFGAAYSTAVANVKPELVVPKSRQIGKIIKIKMINFDGRKYVSRGERAG